MLIESERNMFLHQGRHLSLKFSSYWNSESSKSFLHSDQCLKESDQLDVASHTPSSSRQHCKLLFLPGHWFSLILFLMRAAASSTTVGHFTEDVHNGWRSSRLVLRAIPSRKRRKMSSLPSSHSRLLSMALLYSSITFCALNIPLNLSLRCCSKMFFPWFVKERNT